MQSKKIGNFFKENKIPIDIVLSSEWCRCKDTALYAFQNFETKTFLNSFYDIRFQDNNQSLRCFSSGGLDRYETVDMTKRIKALVTFKLNEVKIYINGILKFTDTSFTVPTGLNTLDLGNDSFKFQGKVYDIRVYDKVLTGQQAKQLTTI